jgi:hypothetical protein
MKKLFLYFSLFIFSLSLCDAQDTLSLKNSRKLAVKVYSASGDEVIYTLPPDEKQHYISQSQIYFIKYADGYRYTIQHEDINQNSNTNNVQNVQTAFADLDINIRVGYSLITLAVEGGSLTSGYAPNILTESPAYNFAMDYKLANHLSLGTAYQSLTYNPLNGDQPAYDETEFISRLNIAFRGLWHLSKNPKNDAYLGFGAVYLFELIILLPKSIPWNPVLILSRTEPSPVSRYYSVTGYLFQTISGSTLKLESEPHI